MTPDFVSIKAAFHIPVITDITQDFLENLWFPELLIHLEFKTSINTHRGWRMAQGTKCLLNMRI